MARVKGGERRESIVRAALDIIAEHGYHKASLTAVAERAGITQQGLMYYFPTKEQLLAAVLDQRDQWDLLNFSGSAEPSAMGATQLAALVDYNATRPNMVQTYTVLAGESVTEGHPARQHFHDRYARARRDVVSMIERHNVELPADLSPEQVATLGVAVLDGLQLQWLLDPDEVDMPAAFRNFLALLGIKA